MMVFLPPCHHQPCLKKTIILILASVLNESCRLRAPTHQTDIKELAAAKADCCVTSHQPVSRPKAALEHAAKTTADSQLHKRTHSPYNQEVVVCTRNYDTAALSDTALANIATSN